MRKRCGIRLAVKLLLVGSLLSLAGLGGAALAQENQARMSVEPPTEQVKTGGPDFTVNILAEDVTNLAAFQFALSYDPSIIKYVDVKGGDFLGSSGRQPQCLQPMVVQGQPETLKFNCVTLGPPVSVNGTPGPDGSGVLAEVTFAPLGGGKTSLELTDTILVAAEIDAQGRPVQIDTAVGNASLEVTSPGAGFDWTLWGTVIGLVALVVVVGAVVVVVRLRGARGSDSLEGT
jgi:hypothetical protein